MIPGVENIIRVNTLVLVFLRFMFKPSTNWSGIPVLLYFKRVGYMRVLKIASSL